MLIRDRFDSLPFVTFVLLCLEEQINGSFIRSAANEKRNSPIRPGIITNEATQTFAIKSGMYIK
jgi:hypothetical protein